VAGALIPSPDPQARTDAAGSTTAQGGLIAESAALDDADVVHVDEALLVVEKPAGLLAVPGRGPDKQDCLAARVQARWPEALVVHRLDEATSGLMMFARSLEAQRRLGLAFERRQVSKFYIAVVHGRMNALEGVIDLPLGPDWPNRPRQRVDNEHGRPALTRWQTLETDNAGERTRLQLEPLTGRTHQLRVHLQSTGHTIVGDTLYGAGGCDPGRRLLLHAAALTLLQPFTDKPCSFKSPVPF
jgi:tRNA pseudouridine32 synthase/23S rRNA pseudouridine746 synthase